MANVAADSQLVIGVVHPGEMGAALGRCFRQRGHRVVWASESRGPRTRERASQAGLEDVVDLSSLVAASEIVISIVPPRAAADVASTVGCRAKVFVDANAISPSESLQLRAMVEEGGGSFVDGSVIGTPPSDGSPVRLFLSGPDSEVAADALGCGLVEAIALAGPAEASALKMCYASWTKGAQALVLAGLAAARAHGVESALLAEWRRSQPMLMGMAASAAEATARKGWRWAYEMQAIADAFRDAGLPAEFHEAAAWIFDHAPRDDSVQTGAPKLGDVLDQLLRQGNACEDETA